MGRVWWVWHKLMQHQYWGIPVEKCSKWHVHTITISNAVIGMRSYLLFTYVAHTQSLTRAGCLKWFQCKVLAGKIDMTVMSCREKVGLQTFHAYFPCSRCMWSGFYFPMHVYKVKPSCQTEDKGWFRAVANLTVNHVSFPKLTLFNGIASDFLLLLR